MSITTQYLRLTSSKRKEDAWIIKTDELPPELRFFKGDTIKIRDCEYEVESTMYDSDYGIMKVYVN